MPLHHCVSYNSDSSLQPNEDNLLLILKLVYHNKKILCAHSYHFVIVGMNWSNQNNKTCTTN